MKNVFLILCSLVVLSCSKDKNNPDNNSASGSISYKVNGTLISMDNANIMNGEGVAFAKQLKGNVLPETRYLLNAQKGGNNVAIMTLVTDSLRTTTYHYDSTANDHTYDVFLFTIMANGNQSALMYGGDYLDVKITSYNSGHISGTFSGKLTPIANNFDYNYKGSVTITDGKLNNIPVIY